MNSNTEPPKIGRLKSQWWQLRSVETPRGWKQIKVEVEIMDKIIPHTLANRGSEINIMPLAMLKKLGLKLPGLSSFVVNVANQR